MAASGKCLKSIVGVKKPEKDDKEKVSGNKNKKWKLWRSSSGDLSTGWKGLSKGSHHRAALETSECSSTADAFNVVATVVRAPPKNFRVVKQEWVAIRIQTAFRGFLWWTLFYLLGSVAGLQCNIIVVCQTLSLLHLVQNFKDGGEKIERRLSRRRER